MSKGVVQVLHSLDGRSRPQIVTDLTERELAAIGLVTVQWSYLEHQLYSLSLGIAEELYINPVPPEIQSTSFARRCEAVKFLLADNRIPPLLGKKLLDLLHRIRRAEVDRHKITHGVWDWDYSCPYRPTVSSTRKPHVFEEGFDFRKLIKLAERIGEINYELTFPNGMMTEDRPWAYMSRRFVAMMQGDENLSPLIESERTKQRRKI